MIFVVSVGLILYEIRPFTNFGKGVAALIWSLAVSIFLTMLLVYLDTPYIFLSLFGVPGLSALLLSPRKSSMWRVLGGRVLGGILSALSVFITLATSRVIEL